MAHFFKKKILSSADGEPKLSKTVHFEFHGFDPSPDAFAIIYDDKILDQVPRAFST